MSHSDEARKVTTSRCAEHIAKVMRGELAERTWLTWLQGTHEARVSDVRTYVNELIEVLAKREEGLLSELALLRARVSSLEFTQPTAVPKKF